MNLKVSKRFALAGGVYTVEIEDTQSEIKSMGQALNRLEECEIWIRAFADSPELEELKQKKIKDFVKMADDFVVAQKNSSPPNFDS